MNDANGTRPKGTRASAWAKWLVISGAVLMAAGLLAPALGSTPMIAMLLITFGMLLFLVAGICGGIGLIRSGGTAGTDYDVIFSVTLSNSEVFGVTVPYLVRDGTE